MSIVTLKPQLVAALATFKIKLMAAFDKKVQQVNQSDNAIKLAGMTSAELFQPVQTLYTSHVSDSNPHGTNFATLGTYQAQVISDLFAGKVSQGNYPITGININGSLAVVNGSIQLPLGSVVVISGIGEKTTEVKQFPLESMPIGPTLYLYLQLTVGQYRLTLTDTIIPESQNNFFITSYTNPNTNNHTIPNTNGIVLRRVDTYRVTLAQVGSAFIATKSDPSQPVSNIWS